MADESAQQSDTTGDRAIVVYAHRGKALTWTLFTLTYTSVIVAVLAFALSTALFMRVVVLVLALVLFGSGIVQGALRIATSAPMVTVTHHGMTVNSGLLGTASVTWAEIEYFAVFKSPVQSSLGIVLSDARPLLARRNGFQRALSILLQDRLRTSRTLIVGDAMLSMPVSKLLMRIRERHVYELTHYHILVQQA